MQQIDTTDVPPPRPIVQLSQEVVNRIAAAEVIHRPSNAIKELVENSLDAGSTSIKVTLKEGGIKMFQVVDNGSGIDYSSLPLLCTRHATSKLTRFSDLESLTTYGFRGEALASVSFVCGKVAVVSKRRGEGGFKAYYQNGDLVSPTNKTVEQGGDVEPKPSAANDGTMITAEDLFYNNSLRRKSFKSATEEHNRVLDVIMRYAVHNPHVGWVCKKSGATVPEITTPSSSTTRQNISILYGTTLAKELLEVRQASIPRLGVEKIQGWVSNPNWSSKKMVFLLFINHRLVESNKIRKAIEGVYVTLLPKGASPWVYLSLEIDPARMDVNVHPTKQEVHFLDEDEVIEAVINEVSRTLSSANLSRTYSVQTLLPGVRNPKFTTEERSSHLASSSYKPAPQHKVRMDHQDRTLESMQMFARPNPSAVQPSASKRRRISQEEGGEGEAIDLDSDQEAVVDDVAGNDGETENNVNLHAFIEESRVSLGSVRALRLEMARKISTELVDILQKHKFVGFLDIQDCMALIQHSTKLYLIHYDSFADNLFYQLGLRQFGDIGKIKLDPSPPLRELISIAVENDPGVEQAGHNPNAIIEIILSRLFDRREMLSEYFSLTIDDDGNLCSLPMLLPGYTPNIDRIPFFLMCLGARVNWEEEQACFHDFLLELAYFYSPRNLLSNPSAPAKDVGDEGFQITTEEKEHAQYQIQHVLFPALMKYGCPSKEMFTEEKIRQLANLPDMYRIFERC